MLSSGDPLWCIADSYLYRPHLQSYFILMGRELFAHPRIRQFFNDVVPQSSRHHVIRAYELGFSKLLCQLGFSWKAFLSADQMLDPCTGSSMGNITAYPLCMLRKGVPMIKVKAITDRRSNYDGLAQTCAYLSRNYPIIGVNYGKSPTSNSCGSHTFPWPSCSLKRIFLTLLNVSIGSMPTLTPC